MSDIAITATGPSRRGSGSRRARDLRRRLAVAAIVLVALFLMVFPVIMLIAGSFRDAPPGADGASWTLDGWQEAYSDSRTYSTLLTTLRITIEVMLVSTPIALAFAWIVARTDTPGRALLERLLLAPLFIPGVLTALAWTVLASPRTGVVNRMLRHLPGLEGIALNIYSEWGMVFIFSLLLTPVIFFLVLPTLKSMNHTLEEAAMAAGASRFTTAVRITLPMMAPAILGATILASIKVFEALDIPAVLRGPSGIDVFMTRVFFAMRFTPVPNYAEATALAVAIVAVAAILVTLQARYIAKRDFTTTAARDAPMELVRLGRWRYVTAGVCWLYLFVAIVVPVAVLVIGSFERFIGVHDFGALNLDNWRTVLDDPALGRAVRNTAMLAFVSAILMATLTIVLSYLIVRRKGAAATSLEAASWLPWSVPGLVLGLGLLWGYSILPGQLYVTRWILIAGFMTTLLPLGVRQFTAAFRQLDVALEEAALTCGARPWRVGVHVIAPLILRTISASMLISMILVLREVGMPAIAGSNGNEVLASLTLYAWLEGRATTAATYGVVMVGMALTVIIVHGLIELALRRWQRRSGIVLGTTPSADIL